MKYKEIHPRYDEKAGKWVVDIVIEGKRKQFSSKLPKAAGRRAVREKALLYLERETDKDGTKFGDVWALYLQDYLRRHCENEQVRQIRTLGALFLLPRLAKRPTGKITIEEWQAILSDAKPQKGNGKLSNKYLSNIKSVISSFCRWAVPRGYMSFSPADALYVPASAPRGSRSILQLDDVSRLFSRRVGLWYERALLVEVLTGLRPGEKLYEETLVNADLEAKNKVYEELSDDEKQGEVDYYSKKIDKHYSLMEKKTWLNCTKKKS